MTRSSKASRARAWAVTLAALGLAAVLTVGYVQRSGRLDPTTRHTALLLLVLGATAGALALRRVGLGEPVTQRPGWRWVGAGAVLYVAAAVGGFALAFLQLDATGTPGWLRSIGSLAGLLVPALTGWALAPREEVG